MSKPKYKKKNVSPVDAEIVVDAGDPPCVADDGSGGLIFMGAYGNEPVAVGDYIVTYESGFRDAFSAADFVKAFDPL